MRLSRATLAGLVGIFGVSLTACGGGNTVLGGPGTLPTATPTAGPVATATPVSTASPVPAAVGSVSVPAGTTTAVTTYPIQAPVGTTATVSLPAGTVVPPGEVVATQALNGPPTSINGVAIAPFDKARALASIRGTRLAGATGFGAVFVNSSNTGSVPFSLPAFTAVSFSVAGLSIPSGSSAYGAVIDTTNTFGYAYNPPQVTCAVTGTTATCTSNQAFSLKANTLYGIVFYYQSTQPTPTPVPATPTPTPVPTTAPGTGTTAITKTGPVAIPATNGLTASIGIPSSTTIVANESITTTVAATATTTPAFAVAGSTPFAYLSLTSSQNQNIVAGTSFSVTSSALSVPAGSRVSAALLDPSNTAGWLYAPTQVVCGVSGTTATCSTTVPFSLVAARQYTVAVYVNVIPAGTPKAQVVPQKVSVAIATPAPGSKTNSVAIASSGPGAKASLTIPSTVVIPKGTTLTSNSSKTAPAGYVAFSASRALQATRRGSSGGGGAVDVIDTDTFLVNESLTLTGPFTIQEEFQPDEIDVVGGDTVQAAVSDGTNWYYGVILCVPSTDPENGDIVETCTYNGSVTLKAGVTYAVAIYVAPAGNAPNPPAANGYEALTGASTQVTFSDNTIATVSIGADYTGNPIIFSGIAGTLPALIGVPAFTTGTIYQYISLAPSDNTYPLGKATLAVPTAAFPAGAKPQIAFTDGFAYYTGLATSATSNGITTFTYDNGANGNYGFSEGVTYGFVIYY